MVFIWFDTALNAPQTAPDSFPLAMEKHSATSTATNAIIAPYSVMPCPRAFLRRFRLNDFSKDFSKNIPSNLPPEKTGPY
jgi:hypothetical protein